MDWKKTRVESVQRYSYIMKLIQVIALMIFMGFMLFKTCLCHAHVDIHFHSVEWGAEQEMREARETLVEEWHLINPEASEEGDERIRQGLEFPI